MARGSKLKKEILDKILETFPGSFLYNSGKELRICGQEDGEEVQIKVALTAAKDNVESGLENILPGTQKASSDKIEFGESKPVEPTAEEKKNVKDLLASLGL